MRKQFILIGMVCSTLAAFTSCRTVAADPSVTLAEYNYVSGELTATFDESFLRVWDASLGAVEELELTNVTSHRDGLSGEIICHRFDGKKITIEIKKRGSGVTGLSIHTGALGDKETSVQIFEKIKEKLGLMVKQVSEKTEKK